ncbi:CD48 antigen-like isoform 1-T1 [Hipposideros larvatus]
MGSRCRCSPGRALLLQTCLLLAIPWPCSQKGRDAGSSCTLNRTVGESVQLPLRSSLHPDVREIEWTWDSEDDKKQFLVSWKPGHPSNPDWYDFEKQYKSRLELTEKAFLTIRNLTMEMGGLYTAKVKFHSGKVREEPFRLCVYEPIPHPQIQIHSVSSTSGWCNVSLECETPGTTETLTVTWLSLPRELEQRGTLRSASSSRNLSLSLPWSQSNGHLTCVVRSPVDEKNTTVQLGSICPPRGSSQSKWLWGGIRIAVLVVSLVAGIWLWMRKKRLTCKGVSTLLPAVPGPAEAPRALATEDSAAPQAGVTNSPAILYAEIMPLQQDTEKGGDHSHSPDCTPALHTVYDNI